MQLKEGTGSRHSYSEDQTQDMFYSNTKCLGPALWAAKYLGSAFKSRWIWHLCVFLNI